MNISIEDEYQIHLTWKYITLERFSKIAIEKMIEQGKKMDC